jgi:DNA repair protein SbcC/Rad50
MRPVRLQLSGFTCFKDQAELSFESLDLFVISGATGAGKSSLLDAMLFALYGRVTRTDAHGVKDLIALGRTRLAVVFDFLVGEQLYRVSRVKYRKAGRGAEAALERWEADAFRPVTDQVGRVDREVERVLGVGFEAFTQAVVLPQGQFATFLHSKPAPRRAMLNQLLRLEVYEHMRKAAAERAQLHRQEQQSLERRLREDFEGVTADALETLRRREQERRQKADELSLRLTELDKRRDECRRDHEKSKELEQKERARADLEKMSVEYECRKCKIAEARRAADVVSLLEQFDTSILEADGLASELSEMEQQEKHRRLDYEEAKRVLDEARGTAQELPALRERHDRLVEVAGKLPLCDELAKQCESLQKDLSKQTLERANRDADVGRLSQEASRFERQIEAVLGELAEIDYDADLDDALEAARSQATLLASARDRLAVAIQDVESKQESGDRAKARAVGLAGEREAAALGEQEAQRQLAAAREATELARDAHAAVHLRARLAVDHPCPVCEQEVALVPAGGHAPALQSANSALRCAESAYEKASGRAASAAQESAAAEAAAGSAQSVLRQAVRARDGIDREVTTFEAQLLAAVGNRVGSSPGQTVDARALAAVDIVATQRARHGKATTRTQDLEQRLALCRQAIGSAESELKGLIEGAAQLDEHLRVHQEALERARAEIRSITTSDDPMAERDAVTGQIRRLETALEQAQRAESESAAALAAVSARAEQLAVTATKARTIAEEAALQAECALRETGFPNAGVARQAVLPPADIARLEAEVAEHARSVHALDTRIAELRQELNGRHVSDQELEVIEAEHRDCFTQHRDALANQAALTERAATMAAKLSLACRLQQELTEHRGEHRVYDHLADDLRSDRLQAYVLEETLTELVRGASLQLGRLTGERYGLDYADDEIVVVDRDNASELRGTDTLSGGETFLASLALALELSAQVQRAVGAVSLDSLFIDEGFGTLDPETLRVVADAVRSLQVGGRMVGIITHIPELKDEFDQRVIVSRDAGVSSVLVESG